MFFKSNIIIVSVLNAQSAPELTVRIKIRRRRLDGGLVSSARAKTLRKQTLPPRRMLRHRARHHGPELPRETDRDDDIRGSAGDRPDPEGAMDCHLSRLKKRNPEERTWWL
jgi:hypothetical protein